MNCLEVNWKCCYSLCHRLHSCLNNYLSCCFIYPYKSIVWSPIKNPMSIFTNISIIYQFYSLGLCAKNSSNFRSVEDWTFVVSEGAVRHGYQLPLNCLSPEGCGWQMSWPATAWPPKVCNQLFLSPSMEGRAVGGLVSAPLSLEPRATAPDSLLGKGFRKAL